MKKAMASTIEKNSLLYRNINYRLQDSKKVPHLTLTTNLPRQGLESCRNKNPLDSTKHRKEGKGTMHSAFSEDGTNFNLNSTGLIDKAQMDTSQQ